MRWGKVVLIFQAVITLIIGIIYFMQFTAIGTSEILILKEELRSENYLGNELPPAIKDIKQRFQIASYIILIVSLMELVIISRLIK